ncbi:MAG: hypothetical protein NZL90_03360 [Aquificaceae bacterium]|nr:hypothetical protein [Aquificaceae bacterium]
MASKLTEVYPRIFLAGGLTPQNVSEAIRLVKPFGVDVSSGIETFPGVKDRKKMVEFMRGVAGGPPPPPAF